MIPRLVAVDMDGTLLDETKKFDTQLLDSVLQKLEKIGGYFVVATGNQYPKSLEYMQDFLNRGIYFIAENGAYIADSSQDIRISGFSEETVRVVLETLKDFSDVGVVVSAHEGAFIPANRAEVISNIVREHFDGLGADFPSDIDYLSFINRFYPGSRVIDSYADLSGKNVVKFALQTYRTQTQEIEQRLRETLPSDVVPVQSGFGAIDLISRGIHKGSSLEWLCGELGVSASEVMAFGDASNDIEMLTFASHGIAMENASADVKAVADEIIGTNQDGAVLKYLDGLLS